MRMFQDRLLIELPVGNVFADDNREFAARVTEDLTAANTTKVFQQERPTGTMCRGEGLLLSDAVRVPRHVRSLSRLSGCRQRQSAIWKHKGRLCLSDSRAGSPYAAFRWCPGTYMKR